MPALRSRGFTLVELMIGVVLLGIVSAGIYRVLVTNQQTYLAQTQRIEVAQNLRAAVTVLPAELRELDATDGDILAMGPTSITIRAMRQLAVICDPPLLGGGLGGIGMTIRRDLFFGLRNFNTATDDILIYYEGDPGTRADDGWAPAGLTGIANQNCLDGRPGWRVTMNPSFVAGQLNVAGAVPNGGPVRGFEIIKYELYVSPSDGRYYLGQATQTKGGGSNPPQPLIGPLSGPNGVRFTYLDPAGNVTAVRTQVAAIEIRVEGQTQSKVRQPTGAGVAYQTDNVTTRVALRNNVRFTGN